MSEGYLISAIMPTRGRPHMAHRAIDCWSRQTGVNTELVILDDLDRPSFFTQPEMHGVRYHVAETKMSIAEKRNRLCGLARGEIIAHFDDDDYSAPGRLLDQLDRLMMTGAVLTGYSEMVFECEDGECFLHVGCPWSPVCDYVIGTSMMYFKSFWKFNPFPAGAGRPIDFVGEDTAFLAAARRARGVASVPAGDKMLARIHAGNSCTRVPTDGPRWRRIKSHDHRVLQQSA